jgi:hypothetical protein
MVILAAVISRIEQLPKKIGEILWVKLGGIGRLARL